MAPSAADLKALVGTRPSTTCAAVGGAPAAGFAFAADRSASTAAGSMTNRSKTGGITTAVRAAAPASKPTKSSSAVHPARPMAPRSSCPATLTISFDMTSGRMVIRIALIQSVPTTSTAVPMPRRTGTADAATAAPTASPATSPMMALVPILIRVARAPSPGIRGSPGH